jgi:hypothetical protein
MSFGGTLLAVGVSPPSALHAPAANVSAMTPATIAVRLIARAGFTARTETVRGHRSGMGARYVLFLGVRS